MRIKHLGPILLLILGGCSTVKVPTATGGSKADGTVVMSYEYGVFESPQIDWSKVNSDALRRCNAWGYKKAEAFGGSTSDCLGSDGDGSCMKWRVDTMYQCSELKEM